MVKLRAFVTGLYYGVYITYTVFYMWQIYKAKKLMAARARAMAAAGVPLPGDLDMGVRDDSRPGQE